jgi:hypothetical protein
LPKLIRKEIKFLISHYIKIFYMTAKKKKEEKVEKKEAKKEEKKEAKKK